jgi:hypothetical protein
LASPTPATTLTETAFFLEARNLLRIAAVFGNYRTDRSRMLLKRQVLSPVDPVRRRSFGSLHN